MKKIISCITILLCLTAPLAMASDTEEAKPKVEVAFVLDTTGSMSGLIQAAKEKVWAIANTLATTKPAPDIKMGLVGYRDRGDEYITKFTDLTDDLDAVYTELMGFSAGGGGDTPESVNQALNEAVSKMTWTPKEGGAFQVIFLVGDCPPHMDYEDDVKYADSCKAAIERGIYINTIQCGSQSDTEPIWSEIARLAEGRYFKVEQDGGAILAETPFDEELAELGSALDETVVYFGSADIQEEQRMRKATIAADLASAPLKAQAGRASFNGGFGGGRNFLGTNELVDGVKNGAVNLEELKSEELPEEMKEMSEEERKAYVEDLAKKREDIQAKIQDLTKKRQAHIEAQIKENNLEAGQSLDHGIYSAIQTQAEKLGIEYAEGPSY